MRNAMPVALALVLLLGCAVEQTEPGEAPDVEVNVDPGRWPDYNVNWADVDVGTTERTVTVPIVRIEEETREVTVPYIDITPPGGREREERTISIGVAVPNAGYELDIVEARAAQDNLWVIARLTAPEPGTAAAQVVSHLSDRVVINAPEDLDVRTVVVGMRPQGLDNQQHRFVDSMAALDQIIPTGARVIYDGGAQAPAPQ